MSRHLGLTSTLAAGKNIQSNLVRATKFADGVTRDWTQFFFFRIMAQAEIDATNARMKSFLADPDGEPQRALRLDFAAPRLVNAGLLEQLKSEGRDAEIKAAHQFRHWMQAVTDAEAGGLLASVLGLVDELGLSFNGPGARGRPAGAALSPMALELKESLMAPLRLMATPGALAQEMIDHGAAGVAGEAALRQSIVGITQYEIMRQLAPALLATTKSAPLAHGEDDPVAQARLDALFDPAAINIALTWNGLDMLGVHPATLASFPEPFREGMAKRARRLHDTGPNSPATWDGPFGLPSIHGYFTGGFLVGGRERRVEEELWRRLRTDIEVFNGPDSKAGLALRAQIGALFRPFGIEIVHLELGQEPYEVDDKGFTVKPPYRVEHFGFRDGLSQPFADLGLKDTRRGGGSPARNNTWEPVAPGELYLGMPDEDGKRARLPVNAELREYGTYVVFRKLEQDVVGFRSFVARQGANDVSAARLAAEFVGRWPSGASLVLSPDIERTGAPDSDHNDFLFAKDDPTGAKCPLGSHIRRVNPRDTGGRGEASRHRIMRRSIAYGGPLLPKSSAGDGRSRGLLFIAFNARLDVQFEVIQADWINGGEFLGQAGLGRCPLTGANKGTPLDTFVGPAGAELTADIPRFVTTRGGEYFFAPGIKALVMIASGATFDPDPGAPHGFSLGDVRTEGLFASNRLRRYAQEILSSGCEGAGRTTIEIGLPPSDAPLKSGPARMVFVGRYDDVLQVLSNAPAGKTLQFSVQPYHEAVQRLTRGHDLLISTDKVGPTACAHRRLHDIRDAAWKTLESERCVTDDMASLIETRLSAELRRCGPAGRIDLVDDLAVSAAHAVVGAIYGVTDPDWLSELAIALPLGKQHASQLPRDWMAVLKATAPARPGLITLQTWSAVMLGDVIANLQAAHEAAPLSRQAGGEMLSHIDSLLAAAQAKPGDPFTLVDAFVSNVGQFVGPERLYETNDEYLRDAALVIAEMTANTIAATPSAFGKVMEFILDNSMLLQRFEPPEHGGATYRDLLSRAIYECDRLNPTLPVLQRLCESDTDLSCGAKVEAGSRVAALIGAANLDKAVFPLPYRFALDRPVEKYLMFGAPDSERVCWGKDIAMDLLVACLGAALSLKNLRRVAGEAGAPRKVLNALTIGLPARFSPGSPGS